MPHSADRFAATCYPESPGEKLVAGWNRVLYTLAPPAEPLTRSIGQAGGELRRRIPVTVLSGFLGAGKTTLVCRLLDGSAGRLVVIVNDLAAVNIDAARIRSTAAETIQLDNGCACCVLGSDLDALLTGISQRDSPPDGIVLEASGVSDPVAMAQTVDNNTGTILDGIVTLVDAGTVDRLRSDPLTAALFQRQLDAAHLVALTKTGALANPSATVQRLASLVPARQIVLLDEIGSGLSELILGSTGRGARPEPDPEAHDVTAFGTAVITCRDVVDADAFFALMACIPECVYRIKGWLRVRSPGHVRRVEFQAAGSRWRATPAEADGLDDQLVVIGRSGDSGLLTFVEAVRGVTGSGMPAADPAPAETPVRRGGS